MKYLKSLLPHLIIISAFLAVSYIYFYPVLEGKVLIANDSSVSNYNSKEIRDYHEEHGKDPLWTNSIFSGMPGYLILTRYPGNLVRYADSTLRVFKMPVSVLFLSMTGFYFLLLIFGTGQWIAVAGAVAYGFSSFFFLILAAGHNTQAIALAYMPLVIGGIYYAYKYDALKGALLTAFVLSLEILANHPQITYYSMICLLVFFITELIASIRNKAIPKFIRTSLVLSIPFIIAIGVNFGNLYTIYEYGKYSIRGKSDLVSDNSNSSAGLNRDYITSWSYGIDETLNLFIPDYKGGSSKPFNRESETVKALRQNNAASAVNQVMKYWGSQPGTDGPHYVGAVVFFLFILGLIIVRGPEKWWLLVATVLSVMLAWGKNFMFLTDMFIDFFPGYNKFRAVTMTLVIAQFCIPLLGALSLHNLFSRNISDKELLKGLKLAAYITGGFLILVLLIPGIAGSFLSQYESDYPSWLKNALVADRKLLLRKDSLRSLFFILVSTGTMFLFLKDKLKKNHSIIIITLLIFFDLWLVDKRYLGADRFETRSSVQKSIAPTFADQEILKDKSYFRVLNLTVSTFNDNSPTSYFHKSIGGYHGAKLRRYQELIDSSIVQNINQFTIAASGAESLTDIVPAFRMTGTFNMLNTKYLIYSPDAPPLVNPYCLGNAWFVEKPFFAENANEELAGVNKIDPSNEAIIDRSFSDLISGQLYPVEKSETIDLLSYQPNELIYRCSARTEKLAVFSEIYYPAGWKCYLDGKEYKYFRANYVLRAMIVPPGDHEIKFSFEPSSYHTGNKISLASSIVLIILLLGGGILSVLRKTRE